jgi:hypothetical protein
MADSPGLTRTNACAHTAISEALLRDIVGTQGRYLTPCPDTPVLGLAHDIYFAFQLHEALRLLTDRIKVRSTLYGYRGDDSRIGHTPPALREQYCSPEHESIRSFIKHMGASTPDSPEFSLPTPYPSQSPETPIKPVEATTKRKRESLENRQQHGSGKISSVVTQRVERVRVRRFAITTHLHRTTPTETLEGLAK